MNPTRNDRNDDPDCILPDGSPVKMFSRSCSCYSCRMLADAAGQQRASLVGSDPLEQELRVANLARYHGFREGP